MKTIVLSSIMPWLQAVTSLDHSSLVCKTLIKLVSWNRLPYCLKLWPRHFFLSSNFSPWPLNKTLDYTKSVFISWSSKQKFFRRSILMAASDTHVADTLDTMHYEMNSVIRSHRVYNIICIVGSNRRTHLRGGACRPNNMMNLPYMAVIKDSQVVSRAPTEIYSQITWYYITWRGSVICCPASIIFLGEGGKEKA